MALGHLAPDKGCMTKETFQKKLGKNIARLRNEAGKTQTEIANGCGKDKQSLNRVENGKIGVSAFYLYQIASELNLPVKELLDF